MTAIRQVADQPPPTLDAEHLRTEFPLLARPHGHRPLVYLDSAATTQKPQTVIDAIADYYERSHANIHRGAYRLSQDATRLYEEARAAVAGFINAADPAECIFTRGTTESINLVAAAWGAARCRPGDEIILTTLEHHSNIVPWQMVAARTGARLRVVPINDLGELLLEEYHRLLTPRTRLVALNHVSNALGTINPVAEVIAAAHAAGALVLVDGAQWVAHGPTDVQALDADFYAFSGHKLYGPTGIGVLYGKRALLEAMPPWQGGGDMIERVTFEGTTYADLPNKFEAGTPHIAGAVGLAAAIAWVGRVGLAAIGAHEARLLAYANERLRALRGVEVKGRARHKAAVLSFIVTDPPIASLDIGVALDLAGICIRTGHHCCQPLMERLGVASTARASFAAYNTLDDIDRFAGALARLIHRSRTLVQIDPGRAPANADHLVCPPAAAESPEAAAAALLEEFASLPDWPARYEYLLDLGQRLPALPDALRTDQNFVPGCQSRVYLVARRRPAPDGGEDLVEFLADSDADLVRGLIALLQRLFCGQRASVVQSFPVEPFFASLGLEQHLSLTRRNGLAALVKRLRELAAAR